MNSGHQKYRKIKEHALNTDQSKGTLSQYQPKVMINIKSEKDLEHNTKFGYFKKNDNKDKVEQKLSEFFTVKYKRSKDQYQKAVSQLKPNQLKKSYDLILEDNNQQILTQNLIQLSMNLSSKSFKKTINSFKQQNEFSLKGVGNLPKVRSQNLMNMGTTQKSEQNKFNITNLSNLLQEYNHQIDFQAILIVLKQLLKIKNRKVISKIMEDEFVSLWEKFQQNNIDIYIQNLKSMNTKNSLKKNMTLTYYQLFMIQLNSTFSQQDIQFRQQEKIDKFLKQILYYLYNNYLYFGYFFARKVADSEDQYVKEIKDLYYESNIHSITQVNILVQINKLQIPIEECLNQIFSIYLNENHRRVNLEFLAKIKDSFNKANKTVDQINLSQVRKFLLECNKNLIHKYMKFIDHDSFLKSFYSTDDQIKLRLAKHRHNSNHNDNMQKVNQFRIQDDQDILINQNKIKVESKDKYVLVLNLRSVMKQNNNCYQVRPGLLKLVEDLKKDFMIVLIGNKDHKVQNYIVSKIGQTRVIELDYQMDNYFDQLKFDENKTLLIDHDDIGFMNYQDNGICIPVWNGSSNDSILDFIKITLSKIIQFNKNDIKQSLKVVRTNIIRQKSTLFKY